MYAALTLGTLADDRAIPVVAALLGDSDINVRYHAIESLAKLKAVEAVDELASIAESQEFFLAFAALDALGVIGDAAWPHGWRLCWRMTLFSQPPSQRWLKSATRP